MSELEYQVMDELYFVQSFAELLVLTDLPEHDLKAVLESLLVKGWIKSMLSREGEEIVSVSEFTSRFASLHYLATKAGLLAHNSL